MASTVIWSFSLFMLTSGALFAHDGVLPAQLGYEVTTENHKSEVWVTYTDTTTGVRVRARFGKSAQPKVIEEFSALGRLGQREIYGPGFWSKEIFQPQHLLVTQRVEKSGKVIQHQTSWSGGRKSVSTSVVSLDWSAELNPKEGCFSVQGEGLGVVIPDDVTAAVRQLGGDAPCSTTRIGRNTVLDSSCDRAGLGASEIEPLLLEGVNRAVQCMKDPARANMSSTAAKMLLLFGNRPRGRDLRLYCTRLPTVAETTAATALANQAAAADAAGDKSGADTFRRRLAAFKDRWNFVPMDREGESATCSPARKESPPDLHTPALARGWASGPQLPPAPTAWNMVDTFARATGPCNNKQFPAIALNSENFKDASREQRMAILVHEMLHVMGFAHGQEPDVNNTLPLCCFNFYRSETDKDYQKNQCKIMRDANVVMH